MKTIRSIFTSATLLILVAGAVQVASAQTAPTQVQFELEGCRNDGTITLPNGSGQYICPDSAYVSGNLGKGWNELDLVPHRLTSKVGNQSNATTNYDIVIAADYINAGKVGYDVVSVPQVNTAKSDASCAITAGPQQVASGVTGGVDDVLYRVLNISQNKGTTCVFDYYQRLALGAAQYSGSSLQAYMFETLNFQTGKRTIPIPVKEIRPQELRKTMEATQNADHVWTLAKDATPARVSFPNTCDVNASSTAPVAITVRWERLPATPSGDITVVTRVYAKNPASRIITVNVSDVIRSGTTVLDSASASNVDVPANTELLVLTHQVVVPAGTTDLNDIATATYTDKVTGVTVPGNTTAAASAVVQPSGITLNQSATINDVEELSGANFTFAVNSTSGANGTFGGGYTLGTPTIGPVTWTSDAQTGSSSTTFNKTIAIVQPTSSNGVLSDTATLLGSNGFTAKNSASIDILANAYVQLTINKSIPNVLSGNETAVFNFTVKDSNGATVATPSITFNAGETAKSVTVSDLLPGNYTVSEAAVSGWTAQGDQNASINLPTCAGSVSFNNALQTATATAQKITVPAGEEAGWEFVLTGPGLPPEGEKVTTTGAGAIAFTTALQEGSYTISEAAKAGFDQTNSTGCNFTVDYPADANRTFACVVTNTKRARLTVIKTVVNDNGGTAKASDFMMDLGVNPSVSFPGVESPGTTNVFMPGTTFNVSESGPAGYAASFAGDCAGTLNAGDDKTCTITNNDIAPKLIVIKHVINDNGGTKVAGDFDISVAAPNASPASFQGVESPGTNVSLDAGNFIVSEAQLTGYTASYSANCRGDIALGETKTCTITNDDQPAHLKLIKVVINNNGGAQLPSAWTLSASGPTPLSGAGPTVESDVNAGSYNLSESGPSGYSTNGFNCGSSITLVPGESKTCTITNDDQPGTLIVKKVVINDNGGTKVATDFTFQVNGGLAIPFSQDMTPDKGRNDLTVNAGSYNVTEPAVYGYTTTYDNCSDVYVPNGGSATCTITNDDQPGTIVVIKNAKPAQGSFAFTTSENNSYTGFTLTGATTNDGNRNTQIVNAGTYTVAESTQLGWLLTGIGGSTDPNTPYNCVVTGSGGSIGLGDLNTRTATIYLKNGDTVTCTFENTGNGATRTQGFWQTHPELAQIAWFGGSRYGHTFPGVISAVGDRLICTRDIDTLGKLMGGFWSDIPKTSTGAKRSSLDQSRMQLLQQLLAAELNASAFGSAPNVGSFSAWESALCGTNLKAIQTAQQQAASFNSSGDSSTFTPGTSANSKYARSIADIPFWNIIKP